MTNVTFVYKVKLYFCKLILQYDIIITAYIVFLKEYKTITQPDQKKVKYHILNRTIFLLGSYLSVDNFVRDEFLLEKYRPQ